jgi:hypothetical protein
MSHVHISTGFLFVLVMLILGLVSLTAWYRAKVKRDREDFELRKLELETRQQWIPRSVPDSPHAPASSSLEQAPVSNSGRIDRNWYAPPAHPVAPPTVIHSASGGNDMLTGVLVGSMLSGQHSHDTAVIHDHGRWDNSAGLSGSEPADTGFSFDSGNSSSSCDSGGLDFSFGD